MWLPEKHVGPGFRHIVPPLPKCPSCAKEGVHTAFRFRGLLSTWEPSEAWRLSRTAGHCQRKDRFVLSSSRECRDGEVGGPQGRVHVRWLHGRLSGSGPDAPVILRLCKEISERAVVPASPSPASRLRPPPVSPWQALAGPLGPCGKSVSVGLNPELCPRPARNPVTHGGTRDIGL